ncbi:MAG TPA: TonB-dependent receptor [Parafilimonas sp.]|nr:TonB-dependent receptor [Parafilimonas sp.]
MKSVLQKTWLMIACMFVSATLWSQTKSITGKVLDEQGNPLAGVSITIKNKTGGTQTDSSGTFSINAANTDVLTATYIGYLPQETVAGNSSNIIIALKAEAAKLGEVVVVGYGTQSRRNITSSVATLDNKVLASAPRSNVGSALQGTVSGLQVVNTTGSPGAAPLILLRGGASINNPGSPLVVVDGVIRSFNDVPSEDIASMDILKDAASTAIYGARANNGVIIITTKQGKAGKAQVSYKFTGGYNQARNDYNYLDTRDYIYYNRLGNLNSGVTQAPSNDINRRGYGLYTDSANLSTFDIRRYDAGTNGYLLSQGWDTVGDPYGGTIIFKDHSNEVKDIVFRNTYTQDHYIDVNGGNEKGKYYASFDYYDEDGIIVGSNYKRYAGNINGSYKIKPNLEVSTGAMLSTSSQIGTVSSEVNTLYRNLALWPTFNPWLDSAHTKPNPGNGISDGNPLYWLDKTQRSNEVNRIMANASLKWDLLPGLYIKASGNVYLNEQLNQSFTEATQVYSNIFQPVPTYNNTSRPSLAFYGRDFQQQYNAIINYDKTFEGKHHVNAMLGTEYYGVKSFAMQLLGTNAPTDDISTVNASTVFVPNSSTDPNNPNNNYSNKSEYRIISAFGRLNYDFDRKYLLTLVFRQDGVSSLASDNRFGFFPGMSAGWNMQEEEFFKNSSISNIVSTFKPRISYGVNGNVAGLGRYEVQGGYGLQGQYNGSAGFLNTQIVNPGLKWEKSKTTDVGADVGFLKNKITVVFDYYNRKTSDLLTNLLLPSYTGFNSIRTNNGTFQNKGYEFAVNATLLNQPNGFRIDFGANASYVKNKILQLPYNGQDKNRQGGLQIYDAKTNSVVWVGGLQEGQPLGNIYAFKQLGIFNSEEEIAKTAGNRVDLVANIGGPNSNYGSGKITPGDVNWLDADNNDTIDSRDQVYVGNIFPKWTGGFNINVSYKGFTLYTRFEFALGHTIYNDLVARTLGQYQGTFNNIDWQKNAWSPTNTQTDIPKVYYADQLGKKNYTRINNANPNLNSNNSRFYEKGDYLASREITLSYDFSKSILAGTKVLSGARIYVSANNLFYITNFSGPSPEPPVNTSGVITGVYQGTYPTPKTFVLGAQVTF